MMIRPKDAAKLIGIIMMAFCAVFVCTLFLNLNIDRTLIKDQITHPSVLSFYDAQVISGKVTSAVSGGCLLLTSVVMLFFYIKHYIDTHKSELGILKAIGYSGLRIAKHFGVFGLSIFAGASLGFCGAFAFMPTFYKAMNNAGLLPDISVHFNVELVIYLIIIPTLAFALLSILYGLRKLRCPVLELVTGKSRAVPPKKKMNRTKERRKELPFLRELKQNTVKSRFSLVFFIAFSSFCYSSMVQMSFSMTELSDKIMGYMMLGIGLVLAFTTLFLAVTTVIKGNTKTIAMLRVSGYSERECGNAILNGYRPIAWIGFVIGTGYQYGLLKMMVTLFFAQSAVEIPAYTFDVQALILALISFALFYEAIMYLYAAKIKRLSLKAIMLDN